MASGQSITVFRPATSIALFALFFLQLLTIWIESMYRMGVIKTSMGGEMSGMLLVFAPLLMLVIPNRREKIALRLAIAVFLAARFLIPLLGVRANIVVAGAGVAAGVVVMTFAFSKVYVSLRRELGVGISLGLLISIALRAWGSSYDPTLGGSGFPFGWGLCVIAALLWWRSPLPTGQSDASNTTTGTVRFVMPVALFANIAILYWVLSSPAVVTAWTESRYLVNVMFVVIGWSAAVWRRCQIENLPSSALLIWNLLFIGSLVGGIYLHTPAVPQSVESSPLIVATPTLVHQLPIYLMCLLSPVVLANLVQIGNQNIADRPRMLAVPMVLGLITLVALTVMAIFTNVWGYVGEFSAPFRGKFYIPFLASGILMMLPVIFASRQLTRERLTRSSHLRSGAVALSIGLIAVCGIQIKSRRNKPAKMTENRITVLTYNLQLGSEPDGDLNYWNQIELLRTIDADIIGLQESDAARPGGGNVDVARLFGDALGYYTYYGPNTIAGSFGTAILSRFPLANTRTIFSFSTKDEAGTAVAEIDIDGRVITIFNSHPAGNDVAKLAHIDDLVRAVEPHRSVIAIGDYNMRQGSVMYDKISAVLVNSWNAIHPDSIGPQHPTIGVTEGAVSGSIDMTRRIDHIFHSADFTATESYYLPSPQSQTDHPAHWSVLTW